MPAVNVETGLAIVGALLRKARVRYPHADRDDLRSDAYFGLAKALHGFQPERGVRFGTYASRCIAGAIAEGERLRRRAMGWIRKRAGGKRISGSQQRIAFESWEGYLEARGHLL